MKVNDIVIINGDYSEYFIVSHVMPETNRVCVTDINHFPFGWYNTHELKVVSEQILRCSLDSLAKRLYNLKSAMKAAGYDTLRGNTR